MSVVSCDFRRENMREKIIEQKLAAAVKKHGGICPKFTSPSFDGMPDRLLLLPHGKFAFVEASVRKWGTRFTTDLHGLILRH